MPTTRLCQIRFDDGGVVQPFAGRVDPAAAQTAPACGLVGGIHGPHRAELGDVLLRPGIGAADLRQINYALVQNCGTRFHENSHCPSVTLMTP